MADLLAATGVFTDAVDALRMPRIVRLGDGLFAVAFQLMKLMPAGHIIEQAEHRGELKPGTRVIETTSGSMGLGLAMACGLHGLDVSLVGDKGMERDVRRRLLALGADLHIANRPAPQGGFQQARLDIVQRLCEAYPDHYRPDQYSNPDNPRSYAPVAELIWTTLGGIDCVVGTVGSGGSTGGLSDALRSVVPDLRLIGVDTPGSVLFGTPERPRLIRGMGSSIRPPNHDPARFDEVHWVPAPQAFWAARQLYRKHFLYMGATSGAAYLVGRWWERRHPGAKVVVILPDEGARYRDTVYNRSWLQRHGAFLRRKPGEPALVSDPSQVRGGWSRMDWGGASSTRR